MSLTNIGLSRKQFFAAVLGLAGVPVIAGKTPKMTPKTCKTFISNLGGSAQGYRKIMICSFPSKFSSDTWPVIIYDYNTGSPIASTKLTEAKIDEALVTVSHLYFGRRFHKTGATRIAREAMRRLA